MLFTLVQAKFISILIQNITALSHFVCKVKSELMQTIRFNKLMGSYDVDH